MPSYLINKPVYLADRTVQDYQDTTEPERYPELYSKFYHESFVEQHAIVGSLLAGAISHALHLGYLGTGSTRDMALDALEEFRKLNPGLSDMLITREELLGSSPNMKANRGR